MISNEHLALLGLAALVAGYIDSIAGGGGMINMPALLLAGLPPHAVLGTNKLAGVLGTLNATRIYIRKKIIDPKPWILGILMTAIGAVCGTSTTHFLSSDHLKLILPWLILAIACYVAWPKKIPANKTNEQPIHSPSPWLIIPIGLIMGWYDGFFGPATGAFLTVIGIGLFRMSFPTAIGMARFLNLGGNLAATLTFALFGSINYRVGIVMALANMIGGHLGAHSAVKFGVKFIKPVFLVIVISMALRLLWLEYFNL